MSDIERLFEKDRKICHIRNILSLLEWDMETAMPPKGLAEREEEIVLLSSMLHSESVSDELEDLVFSIDESTLRKDSEKALLRWHRKNIRKEKSIPAELVERMNRCKAKAHYSWAEAREKGDYALFRQDLAEIIALSREKAGLINPDAPLYDVLLDDYESGLTMDTLDPLFDALEEKIHSIMDRTDKKASAVSDSFLKCDYDERKLENFCSFLMRKAGFDTERGMCSRSIHPFTTAIGPDDVRITNRFTDESFFAPIATLLHETGHALYDMNSALNPEIRGTSISGGASMAFHESQSRFLENYLGRSRSFWVPYYAELQKIFPSLEDVSLDEFVRAINKSQPSAIRVNADELTYSLHIIVRYRMEKALISGSLPVEDLPAAWNEESRKTIRYDVKSDSEGCLQDTHWASALFGYFPTYALGNIYAASIYESLVREMGSRARLESALESADYSAVLSFLDSNIWRKGGIYEGRQLLLDATGKTLETESYTGYLEAKFISLFS